MSENWNRYWRRAICLVISISFEVTAAGQQVLLTAAPVTAIALESDEAHFVIGSQAGLHRCTIRPLQIVAHHDSALVNIHDVKFSTNQHLLIAAGGRPGEAGLLEFWRWPVGPLQKSLQLSGDSVVQVAVSPSGRSLAACDMSGRCQIVHWSDADSRIEFSGHSAAVLTNQFLSEELVASAGVDQSIRIWSSKDGQLIRNLSNHVDAVTALAVRKPGSEEVEQLQLISISQDQTVRRWQPGNGRLIKFCKLSSIPRCLALTADQSECIVGCDDGAVRCVDLESMRVTHELPTDLDRIHEIVLVGRTRQLLAAGAKGVKLILLP